MKQAGFQQSQRITWHSLVTVRWLWLSILLFPVVGAAQEPQTLRWHWQPQQAFRVTTFQKVETETSFGGKPLKMAWELSIEQDWRVLAVADGAGEATVEQIVRRIQVRLDLPPATPLEYDSSSSRSVTGEAKSWASALQPLIGSAATVVITARGEGKRWSPSDELRAVLDAIPEKSNLRPLFSADALAKLARQGICELPEAAVVPGAEWRTAQDLQSSLGKFRQQTTYQLAEAAPGEAASRAKITAVSQLSAGGEAGGSIALAGQRELKKQRQTATYLFNVRAGYGVSGEGVQQLTTEKRVRDTLIETTVNTQWRYRLTPVSGGALGGT
ncbi:MAG: hypothetical protein ACKOBW_14755 [Planctomycetota bacterium]